MKRQTKKFILLACSIVFVLLTITSCYHNDDREILDNAEQIEDQSTDEQNGNTKKPKG